MGVTDDIWEGGGAKPVSWADVGQTMEGTILQIRSKQLQRFGSEQLEEWPDGSPKVTPIITLATSEQDNEDDDGKRDIYLRSNAYTAFGQALREAYKSKPTDQDLIGATLKIQFYKTEKSGKGQPRKLFRARITPKQHGAEAWDVDQPQGDRTPAGAEARTAAPTKPTANGSKPSTRPAAMPPDPPDEDSGIPF